MSAIAGMSSGAHSVHTNGVRRPQMSADSCCRAPSRYWLPCGALGMTRVGAEARRGFDATEWAGQERDEGDSAHEPHQEVRQRIRHWTQVDGDQPTTRSAHADDRPTGQVSRWAPAEEDQARPGEHGEDPQGSRWKAEFRGATQGHVVYFDIDIGDRVAVRLSDPLFAHVNEAHPTNAGQWVPLDDAERGGVF